MDQTAHTNRPDCYGTMFPDVLGMPSDRTVAGKVFSVRLDRAGGMLPKRRSVTTNDDAWDDCLQCPLFDDCYRLGLAKVTLATAISAE